MNLNIPKIWLSAPHLCGRESFFIKEAIESNWVAPLGPNVNGFEKDIQLYNNVSHAAVLSSGTAAIHLALRLLNVEPGDYVIVQSFTFSASVNPIAYEGAIPIFVDSESHTWNMCPQALRQAIEEIYSKDELARIKAIIPVHLYGMPAQLDALLEVSKEFGIPLIEDAAESLGSTYHDKKTGTFGLLGVYSFNGNKIITTSGGGALISDNKELIDKARYLSTQARQPAPHYEHTDIGFNYRLSNILAGIGRGQMEVLDKRISQRRAVHMRYRDYFSKWNENGFNIVFQDEDKYSVSNRWLTAILVDPFLNKGLTREFIRLALDKENIESRPLWKPMHMQPIFQTSSFYGENRVCETFFDIGLCLPSCSSMSGEDWRRITNALDHIFQTFDK